MTFCSFTVSLSALVSSTVVLSVVDLVVVLVLLYRCAVSER